MTDLFSPPEKRVIETENMRESANLRQVINISSYACRSLAGSMDGISAKTNQDGYISIPKFAGFQDHHFFAVMDGHGNNGHDVTDYVRANLPKYLKDVFKEKSISENVSKEQLMQSFGIALKRINNELFQGNIDVSLSGCTLNAVYIAKEKLYCINIGDSRAVITLHKNYEWFVMPLSEDHKPELPREKARIESSGGKVACIEDNYGNPIGPYRLWLTDSMIPGLAMSRSLGDQVGRDGGLIADPDISCVEITKEHKFIILGTDGLFEFISNEDVRD